MTEPAFDWQQLTPVPVAVPEALATRIERRLVEGSIPADQSRRPSVSLRNDWASRARRSAKRCMS